MYSSASGTAALTARRSFSRAARCAEPNGSRYSSMVRGWADMGSVLPPRGFLDVRARIGRLAARLAMVDLDPADAFGRVDRLLAERRLGDPDRDQRAVHRAPGPVGGAVDLFLDRRQNFFGVRVADRARIVPQAGAEDAVA